MRGTRSNRPAALRHLSKQEIDRRIDGVLVEVALGGGIADRSAQGATSPRVITAAELVRRVRPFLSNN